MSIPHSSSGMDFTKQFERLVSNNLDSIGLDNTFLANRLYMSEARLYRLVKQHYELSPNVYIRQARLKTAYELLKSGKCTTVKSAAFEVGFTHVGYFIRRFEEFYELTPGTVQRRESAH